MSNYRKTGLDVARDELMSHVLRCGVLKASADQQEAWMEDTIGFMAERFPDLSPDELGELREIGLRFCQPVIPHGKQHTALTPDAPADADSGEDVEEAAETGETAETEMAGAV